MLKCSGETGTGQEPAVCGALARRLLMPEVKDAARHHLLIYWPVTQTLHKHISFQEICNAAEVGGMLFRDLRPTPHPTLFNSTTHTVTRRFP